MKIGFFFNKRERPYGRAGWDEIENPRVSEMDSIGCRNVGLWASMSMYFFFSIGGTDVTFFDGLDLEL